MILIFKQWKIIGRWQQGNISRPLNNNADKILCRQVQKGVKKGQIVSSLK